MPVAESSEHPDSVHAGVTASPSATVSADGSALKIGELAQRTGKSVRALHLYEELGLLNPAGRTTGRFRLYGDDSVLRVEWIGKLQQLGFTLPQIQEVLGHVHAGTPGDTAMSRVGHLLKGKLAETRETISRLQLLEEELVNSLQYLENCRGCECTALPDACRSCGRPRPTGRPALVAGFQVK
jgi:DNA-binding transcriptional MerR regulator